MVKDWKERIVIASIGTDDIRRKTRPAPLPRCYSVGACPGKVVNFASHRPLIGRVPGEC